MPVFANEMLKSEGKTTKSWGKDPIFVHFARVVEDKFQSNISCDRLADRTMAKNFP